MRRPVSTPNLREPLQPGMPGWLVGDAVLPAAPEHPAPGPPEDPDRMGMVDPAGSSSCVGVASPGMPVPGRVGEHPEVIAKPVVAGPAEARASHLARLLGDRAVSGVGGERI